MTREEAIEKLKNFADHCYPNEEFLMAIKALEQEPYVLCINCRNFDESDNYCKLLQINFLPEGFGCNKGE